MSRHCTPRLWWGDLSPSFHHRRSPNLGPIGGATYIYICMCISRDGSSPSSGAAVTTEPRRFTMMVRTYAVHPLGGVVLMSYPLVAFSAQSSLRFCLVSTPEQFISCPTVISCDWAVLPVDLMHEVVFSTRRDFPDGLGAFGRECRLPKSNRYFRDCGSSCSVNQVDLVVRQSCSCSFPKLQQHSYRQSNGEALQH